MEIWIENKDDCEISNEKLWIFTNVFYIYLSCIIWFGKHTHTHGRTYFHIKDLKS